MKILLALLVSTYSYSQCKFTHEGYDKMNGNYVIRTQSKIIEGSLMSMEGTEVSVSKVYNSKDTVYFFSVSRVHRYESLDSGLPARKVRKGSSLTLLLAGEERIEIISVQDALEAKQSRQVGTIGLRQEHTYKFNILYQLTKEQLKILSDKSLIAIRVNMEDDLGNPAAQDIEVRGKSINELAWLLKCLVPRFFSR